MGANRHVPDPGLWLGETAKAKYSMQVQPQKPAAEEIVSADLNKESVKQKEAGSRRSLSIYFLLLMVIPIAVVAIASIIPPKAPKSE